MDALEENDKDAFEFIQNMTFSNYAYTFLREEGGLQALKSKIKDEIVPGFLSEYSNFLSEEELKKMSNISTTTNSKTISLEELNDVIDKPLENIMVPIVNNLVPELAKLKMAIYHTKKDFGFITSDNPCVWRSFEAHMRPPMFQSPGLNDDTINIILPISPTHCILLTQLSHIDSSKNTN